MTVEITTKEEYEALLERLAERSVDALIESAGDERYKDDVADGMRKTIYDTVGEWWFDHDISAQTEKTIIRYADLIGYGVASHVRTVGHPVSEKSDLIEVDPRDVQTRMALVTLRLSVVRRIVEEHEDELTERALANTPDSVK